MLPDPSVLLGLAWRFVYFSLLSFGAGFAITLPQIHAVFVGQLHWLTDRQFTEVLAVAQASPGPNFQVIPLIGWRTAGPAGALVSLGAFSTIPTALSIVVGRAIRHASEHPVVILLQRSLRSLSAGLWFASGIVLAKTLDHHAVEFGISVAVALLCAFAVRVNPLWWLLGAGLAGALFVTL